jgi:hypothetical protein
MYDAASAYTLFNTVATVTEFEMAVTYPPENLIHTQQSHTILKYSTMLGIEPSSPICGRNPNIRRH